MISANQKQTLRRYNFFKKKAFTNLDCEISLQPLNGTKREFSFHAETYKQITDSFLPLNLENHQTTSLGEEREKRTTRLNIYSQIFLLTRFKNLHKNSPANLLAHQRPANCRSRLLKADHVTGRRLVNCLIIFCVFYSAQSVTRVENCQRRPLSSLHRENRNILRQPRVLFNQLRNYVYLSIFSVYLLTAKL